MRQKTECMPVKIFRTRHHKSIERHMTYRIADELAIRTWQQSYFHTVDSKDWDGFGSVIAENAVFDFRVAVDPSIPPVAGREAIVEFVRTSMEPITSAHRGFLRTLEFTDQDTAWAVWAMEDILWTGKAGSLTKLMNGHGHYKIRYRRINDKWYIDDWLLTRIFVEKY